MLANVNRRVQEKSWDMEVTFWYSAAVSPESAKPPTGALSSWLAGY